MSTILKALRRLEKERTRSDRPLREQVTGLGGGDGPEAGAVRRWPILAGGVFAGVVAGVAVLLFVLSRGGSPLTAPSAGSASPLAAATSPQSAANPAARRGKGMIQPGQAPPANPARRAAPPAPDAPVESTAPPPVLASDDVEVIDRGVPGPRFAPERVQAAAPVAPAEPERGSVRPFQHARPAAAPSAPRPSARAPVARAPVEPTPVEAPPAGAPALAAEPALSGEAAPTQRSGPAPGPARKPVAAAEPNASAPAPAKTPSRPPSPPADPFPALRVERTTWHPLAERRLAVVDVPGEGARELREGDAVAGATVASIEPSGVVFRFGGRDVRRPVGAKPPSD